MSKRRREGWWKSWRSIWDHPIAKNVQLSRKDCFEYLINEAEYDPESDDPRGLVTISITELCKILNRKKQTIWSWLQFMVKHNMIDYENTSDELQTGVQTDTLNIYVCEYNTYQPLKKMVQTGVETTFRQPTEKIPLYNAHASAPSLDEEIKNTTSSGVVGGGDPLRS
jgi:hypothetical protein